MAVELKNEREPVSQAITDGQGAYRFENLKAGRFQLSFALIALARAGQTGNIDDPAGWRRRGLCLQTSCESAAAQTASSTPPAAVPVPGA